MHRDSKFIFESYKTLKEQTNNDIVNEIKSEQAEMAKVLAIIQGSNLNADVKKAMQQLLQNGNVLTIYKQIKSLPSGYEKNPDLVNLQSGSVSEPGSPSATGTKQPSPAPSSGPTPQPARPPMRLSF